MEILRYYVFFTLFFTTYNDVNSAKGRPRSDSEAKYCKFYRSTVFVNKKWY